MTKSRLTAALIVVPIALTVAEPQPADRELGKRAAVELDVMGSHPMSERQVLDAEPARPWAEGRLTGRRSLILARQSRLCVVSLGR